MTPHPPFRKRAAFTLIEIMVVCAIIGIVLTMAIPPLYRRLHPDSMQKAVQDIKEACEAARARAVLDGSVTKLVIRKLDRRIDLVAGSAAVPQRDPLAGYDPQPDTRLESKSVSGEDWQMADRKPSGSSPTVEGGIFPVKISEHIHIEGIRLHLKDFTDVEVVEVNFYPNGTCDEFSMFLAAKDNDRRQISLEVATALVDVESDYRKFR